MMICNLNLDPDPSPSWGNLDTQRGHDQIPSSILSWYGQSLIHIPSDIVEAVLSAVDIALDAAVGPFWQSNEAIDWFEINQRR